MRNRFGEVFNAKLRHNILSVIAIVLFLFALVVTIIALTKTPDMEEVKKPPVMDDNSNKDPSSPSDTPSVPAGSISTFHELSLETTLTEGY